MDASERKKKAPPLPKFQQSAPSDPKVIEKVTDFLQQISKEVSALQKQQKLQTSSSLSTPVPAPTTQPQKKKFSLASINSKLNSIMSTKKIDLNKVVQNSKKTEPEKNRRDIEIQYDPANPNSYQQAKSHYFDVFNKIREKDKAVVQEDNDDQISKMIAEFQKNGEEMIDEEKEKDENEEIQDINRLDDKESVALRMMQKYGFKVGQGLGKQSQGIRTPLTIKKLTDSSCKIQPSSLSLSSFITAEQCAQNSLLAFKIQKSRVVALKIQMQLTQLTDQSQLEIKQQCSKYGQIISWMTYMTADSIIFFAHYSTIQSAFQAFVRLNGRYYDEKVIRVFYYSQAKFQEGDLAVPFHQIVQF